MFGLGRRRGHRPSLALGMNMSTMYTYEYYDPFWDRMRYADLRASFGSYTNAVVRGRNNQIVNPTASSSGTVNASADGSNVSDAAGNSYGAIKMDLDGRVYPTNGLSITKLTWYLQEYYDSASIPTGYMLLDLHGTGVISGLSNHLTIVRDLGGGRYIIDPDVTVKYNRSFSVLLSTMDSGGIKPTMTPCVNDLSATDPTGNTAAGRISNPDNATRLGAACSYVRALDWFPINNDLCGSDSPTVMATRTVECKERVTTSATSNVTRADMVKFCNEAGVGLQVQFSHRDDPTLIPTICAALAQLNSKICIIELANETWNGAFQQGVACTLLGCRAGFDVATAGVAYADTAGATPRTIYSSNTFGNEVATLVAVPAGQQYMATISGLGSIVFKTTQSVSVGAAVPIAYSSTTSFLAGTSIMVSGGKTVTFCAQATLVGSAYDPNTTYVPGQIIKSPVDGQPYYCTVSSKGLEPSATPANWRAATLSDTPWLNATTAQVAVPQVWASNLTYNPGDLIYSLVDSQTYYCTVTGLGFEPSTNPGHWRLATSTDTPWLSVSPSAANGGLWLVVSPSSMTSEAMCRWKTSRMKLIKSIADPLFDAAGKQRPLYAFNVQMNGTTASFSSQAQQHLNWDGGWGLYDMCMMAPYIGGAISINNDVNWIPFGDTTKGALSVGTLAPADKLAMYDATLGSAASDADTAVALLASKMLDPAVTALIGGAYVQALNAQRGFYRTQAAAQGVTKTVYMGTYECGVTGNSSRNDTATTAQGGHGGGWPELLAGWSSGAPVQWSNTKAYSASVIASMFAWDGGELYRCYADNTGIQPSADGGTNWKKVSKCTNGKSRFASLWEHLLTDAGAGTWFAQFYTALQTTLGDGYYCMYQEQSTMTTNVSALATWGFRRTSADVSSPMWQACIAANTAWKALAA